MKPATLEDSVQQFVEERRGYYEQWLFDEPLVVSKKHNDRLKELQKVMHKMITHFVTNYESFQHLMPVSEHVAEVLRIMQDQPYKVGTYRTDFVYDTARQAKIIEITCRFALNGMLFASIFNQFAEDFRSKHLSDVSTEDLYRPIFKHLETYYQGCDSIMLLRGADVKNESKLFTAIFERTGMVVKPISVDQIEDHLEELSVSWIISELSFDEILSIPKDLFIKLSQFNVINDFRTIFLIHDKRFFSVMGNVAFQQSILNKEEIALFNTFYVPTFTASERADLWEAARLNKSDWIIKHRALGKSQKIYAGLVTDEAAWQQLFDSEEFEDLVLQKWVDQQKITGTLHGDTYNDYVTGTLLFFDDHYFGFGDFRTSSHPVINKTDHRKFSSLILSNTNDEIQHSTLKNFIP